MANLGYVGLGVMGGRLLSKGHSIIGTNRTKSKATDPWGTFAKQPAE